MDPRPALELAQRLGASYADARVQRSWGASVELRDGRVEQVLAGTAAGAGVRALVEGAWGFAWTSRLELRALREAAEQAVRAARVTSLQAGRERVKLAPVRAERARVVVPARRRPGSVPLEERVALLRALDRIPKRRGMAARTLGTEDGETETRFTSSEGADVTVRVPRTLLLVNVTAEARGRRASYRSRLGGTKGFELLAGGAPEALAEEACEAAARLAGARAPKGGRLPVVVDPDLAGVFAHEAMGHACEADLVVSGDSLLAGRLGQDLGNPGVSIADDATIPGSFGFVAYDDEGLRGQRRLLVDKGRLRGFLHSRETAAKLGLEPNGAARAQGYAHRPLVRMSNTVLLPGDWSFEEMLEGVKEGVYVKGTRGGQVDTTRGTFHFSAQEAFAIRRGELGPALRDVSLSGSILTTLKKVDALGSDFRLSQPGFCGKGQWVPVGDGGPHFRVRDCVVGGG